MGIEDKANAAKKVIADTSKKSIDAAKKKLKKYKANQGTEKYSAQKDQMDKLGEIVTYIKDIDTISRDQMNIFQKFFTTKKGGLKRSEKFKKWLYERKGDEEALQKLENAVSQRSAKAILASLDTVEDLISNQQEHIEMGRKIAIENRDAILQSIRDFDAEWIELAKKKYTDTSEHSSQLAEITVIEMKLDQYVRDMTSLDDQLQEAKKAKDQEKVTDLADQLMAKAQERSETYNRLVDLQMAAEEVRTDMMDKAYGAESAQRAIKQSHVDLITSMGIIEVFNNLEIKSKYLVKHDLRTYRQADDNFRAQAHAETIQDLIEKFEGLSQSVREYNMANNIGLLNDSLDLMLNASRDDPNFVARVKDYITAKNDVMEASVDYSTKGGSFARDYLTKKEEQNGSPQPEGPGMRKRK